LHVDGDDAVAVLQLRRSVAAVAAHHDVRRIRRRTEEDRVVAVGRLDASSPLPKLT
jgi:hypothetical protein